MTTLNEFSFSKDLTHVHVIGDGVTAKAVRLVVARLEGFVLSELNSADIVVPSPGIDPKDYPETSAEIMSEPEFAYRLMRRPNSRFSPRIIAVTGTNGKSTLTALIAHVLGIPGLGNIGVPMITYVDKCCSFDWIVVELSSYQLDGCRYFLPDIAVLLNITPDHMTRYHGFDQYIASKEQLITLLSKDSILFYNQDCSTTKAICEKESVCQHKVKLSQTAHLSIQEALSSVPVYGAHAWFNLKACYLIAEVVGVPESMILSRCKSFESLPHRFEVFCEYQGLVFINDSKSTTPESSLVAIEAASSYGLPIHMILCGDDKGLSVSQLVSTIPQIWLHHQ